MADCLPKNISPKIISLFLVVAAFLSLLPHSPASASTLDWLSSGATAEVTSAPSATPIMNHAHQCKWQSIAVDMFVTRINACVFQAKSFRLAYSDQCLLLSQYCHSDSMIAVSVGSDTKFYRVNNVYALFGNSYWYVSPDTDTIIFNDVGSIRIYDNVPLNLEPAVTATSREYAVRYQSIRPFVNTAGRDPMAQKIAISNNGEWLVTSILNFGLVRIHVPDGTFRIISNDTSNSGNYEFAITNDGNYIAIGGDSATPKIYKVDESCGKAKSVFWANPSELQLDGGFVACSSMSLATMIQNAAGIAHDDGYVKSVGFMTFSQLDDSLTLLERYNSTSERWLKLKAPGYVASRLDYLAVGDSISSGEGDTEINKITNGKYYREGTDVEEDKEHGQPYEKCHTSTRSYPYILAKGMNLSIQAPVQWQSVACSGATSYDIGNSDEDTYDGQGHRLKGYDNLEAMQIDALDNFIPGRIAQIEFIKKYKPRVITINLGANDVDFGDKLKSCVLSPTACQWTDSELPSLASQIKNEYKKLLKAYADIRNSADDGTKIYAIGYPYLMSSEVGSVCSANVGTLTLAERKVFVDATVYMNSVIESAAKKSGIKYIDISDALLGERLCEGSAHYVNGIAVLGHSETMESFHPNQEGHKRIAAKIKQLLGTDDLLSYNNYPMNIDDTVSVPIIPSELGGETGLNSENSHMTDSKVARGDNASITVNPISLQPLSIASLVLHSDPLDLGNLIVGSDGSLRGEITIPATIQPGYHTLILKGRSFSGEDIEMTQTVLIVSKNSSDQDDNGRLDSQEICGPFWTDFFGSKAEEFCKDQQQKNILQNQNTTNPIHLESDYASSVGLTMLDSQSQISNIGFKNTSTKQFVGNLNIIEKPIKASSLVIFYICAIISLVSIAMTLFIKRKGK